MPDAVTEAAEQQRHLVADTSRQLRNPMAAQYFRIDTLGTTRPADSTYLSTMAEAESLESLLDGLITLEKADTHSLRVLSTNPTAATISASPSATPATGGLSS